MISYKYFQKYFINDFKYCPSTSECLISWEKKLQSKIRFPRNVLTTRFTYICSTLVLYLPNIHQSLEILHSSLKICIYVCLHAHLKEPNVKKNNLYQSTTIKTTYVQKNIKYSTELNLDIIGPKMSNKTDVNVNVKANTSELSKIVRVEDETAKGRDR